jgi:protein-disulfide isomerase
MKVTQIFSALAVVAGLALSPLVYADSDFTSTQKEQIGVIIHDYLVKNPEVLSEAMQTMQQKQMDEMRSKGTAAALKNAGKLVTDKSDPVVGNPDGKITLVEFFDYQCPHCVDMDPDLVAIMKANPNLRVVLKEFPIRGPISIYAAKAALAANKQGKYWPMHEALMKSAQSLTEAKIIEIAQGLGLDVKKLKADIASQEMEAQIKQTYKLAQELQLYGTPALFVVTTATPKDLKNIDFIPGQVDQKYLQSSIDKIKTE